MNWQTNVRRKQQRRIIHEIDIKYSKAEVKSIIKAKINEKWQFLWDNEQTGR